MTTGGPPPLPPQDSPPTRDVWLLYTGLIVSVPVFGLVLLEVPQPGKAVLLFLLVILLLVLLRRLIRLSRVRRKRR